MVSVSRALGRIKSDLRPYLPDGAIEAACRDAGHEWRERKLGPVATVHLFLLQVLSFNTAMTHVRHLAGQALTAGAYCRARTRLPLEVLQRLLRDSSTAMRAGTRAATTAGVGSRADPGLWRGLRAYLVDGSSTIVPDVPELQKAFGQPKGCKPGCGFPVPKLLGLFDAFSGLVVELLALPLYTHEQSKVWRLHPLLGAGDLLVGDCGFCSFAHLAMLWGRGVCACFRIHQRQIVDFRPHRRDRTRFPGGKRKGRPTSVFVRRLGRHDHVVRWRKQNRPGWMSGGQWDALPESLEVREIRYTIPPRPADAVRHRRYHAAGPEAVPEGRGGRVVPRPLAGGDALRAAQDHAEDAQAQEQDRGRRAQGAGRLLPGVQPRARTDDGGGRAAGRDARPRELPRRGAVAARGRAGGRTAGVARQPAPPRPARTEGG